MQLTLKLKTPVKKESIYARNEEKDFTYFSVPANQYFSPDRFSISKGTQIPLNEIFYDQKTGEIRLSMRPNTAYFIERVIQNYNSIVDRYTKIEIISNENNFTVIPDTFEKSFPYNENCDCFLLIYK
ncbi:hypothetical protein EHQ76_07350 [Leptospira barantonii]|uniref:Uncharacterized protein n=1 Tax=Leptospira barantonii TaxID=2023184 RepID=A0A5F2BH03_9LEPT|nr:hypothetical protein [Leptospira barantonii]TGM04851.1 hypothetical protein EHQ76_07350 [Leptospira barantonii]